LTQNVSKCVIDSNLPRKEVSTEKGNNLPSTRKKITKTRQMYQLPGAFLDFLANTENDFVTLTSEVVSRPTSKDGSTTKMAIRLQDNHLVEGVLMKHSNRVTLCVSSQVGCAMGCTFCATGTMGIRGNLSSGEILEQLVHAGRVLSEEGQGTDVCNLESTTATTIVNKSKRKKEDNKHLYVRNIVFMGMGEPLNNYKNVIEACRGMIDRRRWNLAYRRVTISTVGVTSKMRQLTRDLPEVNLALSLHAPNQSLRESIVPTAKMYPINDMIDALDNHLMAMTKQNSASGEYKEDERKSAGKRKRAMIEYVMLNGETSTYECAHQLGKLCENRHIVVNLIPYNSTDVKDKLVCPSEDHVKIFQNIVSTYGVLCFIRRTMGADIAGACGQLVKQVDNNEQTQVIRDIEDAGEFDYRPNEIKKNPIVVKKTTILPLARRSNERNNSSESCEKKSIDKRKIQVKCDVRIEQLIIPLTIATVFTSLCFVVSVTIMVSQRKRR